MVNIDLCPFFNETEVLRARVCLLTGTWTNTYVAEAHVTHQGEPKPLYLDGTDLPVGRMVADLSGHTDNWSRERAQRDALRDHPVVDHVDPDDLVLSCDVDELIDPKALPRIAEATEHGPVRLGMRMFYYGLDWEDPAGWGHPVAFRARDLPDSLSELRLRPGLPGLPGCGWHVSYVGGRKRRRAKVEAFAHAENRAPEVWQRIETGDETGVGPNGEQLVPATDVPDILRRAFQ